MNPQRTCCSQIRYGYLYVVYNSRKASSILARWQPHPDAAGSCPLFDWLLITHASGRAHAVMQLSAGSVRLDGANHARVRENTRVLKCRVRGEACMRTKSAKRWCSYPAHRYKRFVPIVLVLFYHPPGTGPCIPSLSLWPSYLTIPRTHSGSCCIAQWTRSQLRFLPLAVKSERSSRTGWSKTASMMLYLQEN
jgi:hypothetical protein